MMARLLIATAVAIGSVAGAGALFAGPISVPNGSFESPVTPFVNTHVDSWEKAPKPEWYVEGGGYTWDQLGGVFKNTPPGSQDHIGNCDGNQALWIFAVPEVCLFQDYDSTDWSNPIPTHAFDAVFEVGKSYRLTVGVIGGGGNMLPGVSLELSLYYRDGASIHVSVAAISITNSPVVFANTTNFVDFNVEVPAVKPRDAWAGQHIGVRLLSTVGQDLQGGYWDVDNVRLAGFPSPAWANPVWSNGLFTVTLESEPGLQFEILASPDPAVPIANWASLGTLTNMSGNDSFTDTAATPGQRYYQAVFKGSR